MSRKEEAGEIECRGTGSDEACFDRGGRGFITRGRLRGSCPVPTTGVMCPAGKTTRPCSLLFLLCLSPSVSLRASQLHSPSPSAVIRSHRQKGLAARRLRSSSSTSTSSPGSCPPSQVCNKDVTRALRDTGPTTAIGSTGQVRGSYSMIAGEIDRSGLLGTG